jgi:hypothetical protein
MSTSDFKKRFNLAINLINLMPIVSSKGLGFYTVTLVDCSFICSNADAEGLSAIAKLLDVGLVCARTELWVSCYRKNQISQGLSKSSVTVGDWGKT